MKDIYEYGVSLIALQRPAGAETGPRLLPGADQEHLGCGPRERSPGRGALLGTWDLSGYGAPLRGGVHWGPGGRWELIGGENKRVDGVCGNPCQGRSKAPAVT